MRTQITLNDLIFIGIKGGVVALHARDGQEVWQSKLKGSQFTNITLENGRLLGFSPDGGTLAVATDGSITAAIRAAVKPMIRLASVIAE